ncbi:MAG: hypothetical protein ABGX13_04835, partial [Methylophilaceae bacterium]
MVNGRLTQQHLTTPLVWLITLCLLSTTHWSFSADKIGAAKKDISGIQKQINKIKKKLNKTKKQQHDVTDALKKSETAISHANKTLHKIKQDQKKNKSNLSKLKKQSLTISQ